MNKMAKTDVDINAAEQSSSRGCILCVEWLSKKLKLLDKGATPPNWKYIGLVFMALFSSSVTLTFLFPFLPEMMLTFGYKENEIGTYCGMVASSVFAGRAVGSVFWGWLADRRGRKIVLLITIGLNGLFAGLFGFSHNLILAMLFRFLCGAVNGTVGTAKAILYDVSDNTNQALSMSMLSISWGLGMIIGPSVGGVLASPADRWPHVFSKDGLFGQFPFLLPSIFPLISCTLIFILIFFKFDETFVRTSKSVEQEVTINEPAEVGKEDGSVGKDGPLPLLSSGDKASHNSLLRIGQTMQSVHLEAESSAYLAMEALRKTDTSSGELLRLPHKATSMPDVTLISPKRSGNSKASYEIARPFQSLSNICENDYHSRISHKLLVDTAQNVDVTGIINKNDCQNGDENGEMMPTEGEKLLMEKSIGNGDCNIQVHDVSKENTKEDDEHDQHICNCVESCCRLGCCRPFRGSSMYKLLRLTDVWATVMLYTVFSFVCIAIEDIFPVFAATTVDYGGLGFTTDEIGLALGIIFMPLLVLQIKLYPFLVSRWGIRKVFLFSAMVCMICSQSLPMVRILRNSRVWLWVCLFLVQVPIKIGTNCCFAGTSLLINNSVKVDLAGQVNGLAMMTTAIGRTFAPTVAGSFFSWAVTYGPEIGTPFDTSFPFFVLGLIFFIAIFECLHLNPALDKQKK